MRGTPSAVTLVRAAAAAAVGFGLALASPPAGAQTLPAPSVEFTAGYVGFADDGVVGEGLIGGAGRVYVLPRLSLGPEVSYIVGENHTHLVVTANVAWDVFPPRQDRASHVTPFLVVGGGVFRTHEHFFAGSFTASEGAFTAGGGLRAVFDKRFIVGVEARVGWELHPRVNGTIGVRLGR